MRFPADDSQLVSVSHRISTLPVWCLSPCLRHFSPQSRDCFVKVSSSKGLACDAWDEKKYLPIHKWLTFTHPIRFGCPAGSDLVTILNTLIIIQPHLGEVNNLPIYIYIHRDELIHLFSPTKKEHPCQLVAPHLFQLVAFKETGAQIGQTRKPPGRGYGVDPLISPHESQCGSRFKRGGGNEVPKESMGMVYLPTFASNLW